MSSKEPSKKENLWNNILNETGQKNKFQNKQVLVLGTRGTGKRTLIDSLHEISQTIYPKIRSNEMQSGKLRIAGSVSALDYVYLNVKNLDDQDEDTMAKLGFYIIDEETQSQLLPIVLKQNTVKDTLITIMLDLSEPWTFMEQLDKWIEMITNHLQSLQINLETLDQMRAKVEKLFRDYKEPVLDSDGKLVKSDTQISPEEEAELIKLKSSVPLPEGSLTSNLGIPIVILANKSDLIAQSNDQQSQIVLYYLRKYCLQYGASLVFTSSKNQESLEIYYEYMLHTLYGFKNKNKSEIYTIDSIFIPSGSDNLNLLKQSNSTIFEQCDSKPYEELVKRPTSKNQRQEEVVCEDEQEFLKNLVNDKSNPEPIQSAKSSISAILQSGTSSTSTRTVNPPIVGNQGTTSVAKFYQTLLNQPNDARRLRENAERDLQQRVGNSTNNYFRNDEIQQVKDIIKKQN
ncbi:cytoplasmic dynein 1 light intermediate chain 1 (macronuclear) [Tetrahymena thermophila SB210]|uniref:Dynein light intermediate chain n=2 Tax=Tetrahymena thermophila TaxID=5911 RepID=I7M0X3_TETTS|nr:cytoplasmic dynein 1 light intermediate chain 1 [Tetrahymena thermophila SB210]ABV90642.1 cytoplasmic dynein light intermediate chain [Tetrahymena thermophila]EAR92881.3 cytoplasmic dynein 1 light intermediate chain 1 [Tetrahymena thermophila SB210]|eukprot:XP_001013126.3 cytoplasmic dynein 1 light intermediate chain 1 [Tetrahymena thermophila SB210]